MPTRLHARFRACTSASRRLPDIGSSRRQDDKLGPKGPGFFVARQTTVSTSGMPSVNIRPCHEFFIINKLLTGSPNRAMGFGMSFWSQVADAKIFRRHTDCPIRRSPIAANNNESKGLLRLALVIAIVRFLHRNAFSTPSATICLAAPKSSATFSPR